MADEDSNNQYDQFVNEFTNDHFSSVLDALTTDKVTLVQLIGSSETSPRSSELDKKMNRDIVKAHLSKYNSNVVSTKLQKLVHALKSKHSSLNDALINKIIQHSRTKLLSHLLLQVGGLSSDEMASILANDSAEQINFRSLLVGLSSLLVAKLQQNAKTATFRLNLFALIDPADLSQFKGAKLDLDQASSLPKYEFAVNDRQRLLETANTPPSYNWVEQGKVGPVQVSLVRQTHNRNH